MNEWDLRTSPEKTPQWTASPRQRRQTPRDISYRDQYTWDGFVARPRELALELNRTPTLDEWDHSEAGPKHLAALRILGYGGWDELVRAAGLPPTPGGYTDGELLAELARARTETGPKRLTAHRFDAWRTRQRPGIPTSVTVRKRLGNGSWPAAMDKLAAADRDTLPVAPSLIPLPVPDDRSAAPAVEHTATASDATRRDATFFGPLPEPLATMFGLYWDGLMSLNDVAALYGSKHPSSVLRRLKRAGLPTRSLTDALRLARAIGRDVVARYADDVASLWRSGGPAGDPGEIAHELDLELPLVYRALVTRITKAEFRERLDSSPHPPDQPGPGGTDQAGPAERHSRRAALDENSPDREGRGGPLALRELSWAEELALRVVLPGLRPMGRLRFVWAGLEAVRALPRFDAIAVGPMLLGFGALTMTKAVDIAVGLGLLVLFMCGSQPAVRGELVRLWGWFVGAWRRCVLSTRLGRAAAGLDRAYGGLAVGSGSGVGVRRAAARVMAAQARLSRLLARLTEREYPDWEHDWEFSTDASITAVLARAVAQLDTTTSLLMISDVDEALTTGASSMTRPRLLPGVVGTFHAVSLLGALVGVNSGRAASQLMGLFCAGPGDQLSVVGLFGAQIRRPGAPTPRTRVELLDPAWAAALEDFHARYVTAEHIDVGIDAFDKLGPHGELLMRSYGWSHARATTRRRASDLGAALRSAAENDPRFRVEGGANGFDLSHPAVPASKITGFAELVADLPASPILFYGGDSGSDFTAVRDAVSIAEGVRPDTLSQELFDAVVGRWPRPERIISVAVAGPHTPAAFARLATIRVRGPPEYLRLLLTLSQLLLRRWLDQHGTLELAPRQSARRRLASVIASLRPTYLASKAPRDAWEQRARSWLRAPLDRLTQWAATNPGRWAIRLLTIGFVTALALLVAPAGAAASPLAEHAAVGPSTDEALVLVTAVAAAVAVVRWPNRHRIPRGPPGKAADAAESGDPRTAERHRALLDALRSGGGFAFDPRTCDLIEIGHPSGLVIAIPGTEHVLHSADASPEKFVATLAAVMRSGGDGPGRGRFLVVGDLGDRVARRALGVLNRRADRIRPVSDRGLGSLPRAPPGAPELMVWGADPATLAAPRRARVRDPEHTLVAFGWVHPQHAPRGAIVIFGHVLAELNQLVESGLSPTLHELRLAGVGPVRHLIPRPEVSVRRHQQIGSPARQRRTDPARPPPPPAPPSPASVRSGLEPPGTRPVVLPAHRRRRGLGTVIKTVGQRHGRGDHLRPRERPQPRARGPPGSTPDPNPSHNPPKGIPMSDRATLLARLWPDYNPLDLLSDRGRRMFLAGITVIGLAVYAWLFVLVNDAYEAAMSQAPAPPAAALAAASTAGAKATAPPAPQRPATQPPRAQRPAAQPPAPATRSYRVVSGDTLTSVALRHGVDYQRIAADNQLANPNLIHPGQRLRIAQPAPGVHLIAPGETLSGLARQSGLTIRQLRALNPWITNPNRINAGLGLRMRP